MPREMMPEPYQKSTAAADADRQAQRIYTGDAGGQAAGWTGWMDRQHDGITPVTNVCGRPDAGNIMRAAVHMVAVQSHLCCLSLGPSMGCPPEGLAG